MTQSFGFRGIMLALLLLFTAACSEQRGEGSTNSLSDNDSSLSDDVSALNDEALALMRGDGDPKTLKRALEKLDKAIELQPETEALHANRMTVLLELRRYPEAIEEIEGLIALTGYQQHGLMLCMVKEVSKETGASASRECYETVAEKLREEQGEAVYGDVNYLLTLKMAESERFPEAADKFLSGRTSEVEREFYEKLLLIQSRDQILSDMFG